MRVSLRASSTILLTGIILTLWLGLLFNPLPAIASDPVPGNMNYQFSHFLNQIPDNMPSVLLQQTLGKPDRRVRKLAGWEYWYYHQINFNGIQISGIRNRCIPFKNGAYVPSDRYHRMKNKLLNGIFLPILPFVALPYPWSATALFCLMGVCLYGLIMSRWPKKFLSLYLILGILLALRGAIF